MKEIDRSAKDIDHGVTRDQLMELHKTVEAMPENLGENPYPLEHYFAKGLYGRKLTIPQGHLVVGKIHKYSHLVIFLTGDVMVVSEESRQRVKAPAVFNSPEGAKRAFYAYEDTTFMTVHATECEDVDYIEEALIAKDYDELKLTQEDIKAITEEDQS